MSRALPEWIGAHPDSAIPARVRLRIFERHDGRCQCGCGRKIVVGERWELDHAKALINGGQHCESNLRPLLKEHHRKKSKDDVALKSYNYRRKLAHAGIKRSKSRPLPGGRNSPFKKKVSGEVIARRLYVKW